MKEFNVIAVDDQILCLEGITSLVNNRCENATVIATIRSGDELINYLEKNLNLGIQIDLILMDIEMPKPNGIETTKIVLRKYPELKIAALTVSTDIKAYNEIKAAGAKGFILKNIEAEELSIAIQSICKFNTQYVSQEIINILSRNDSDNILKTSRIISDVLDPVEVDIFKFIYKGFSDKDIVDKLGKNFNLKRVEYLKDRIRMKTGTKNNVEIIRTGITNNWISLDELKYK